MSTLSTAPRIAVIGLDSADPGLIKQWCDKGLLPTFSRLIKEGSWVNLKNRGEFPSMSVWPSIFTGTHLGKHGIYFPVQLAPGKPRLKIVRPEQCTQRPFWAYLASEGKRSVIFDVPFTHPLPSFNGVQICDLGGYERYGRANSEPAHEIRTILRRFGPYPFGDEMRRNTPITDRALSRTRRQLLSAIPLKGQVIRHLIGEHDWDFFMAVFGEPHPAGHYFWHGVDCSTVRKTAPEFGFTVLDVYQRLDSEIGKIAVSLDGRTALLIISGHGIGPNHTGWHLVPDILKRIDCGHADDRRNTKNKSYLLGLRESVPRKWRDAVSHRLPDKLRDCLQIHWATERINWHKDSAFALPTDAHGFVRVSLKGRDPNGRVKPGHDYETICQEIVRILTGLVDPQTGKRVVEQVFLTDEIFPGPERDSLPDLIVKWRDDKKIDAVCSTEIGTIEANCPDPRSGGHRSEGFALLYGPGFSKGYEFEGHLLDIAPTIFRFYGHDLPKTFDGRPWTDIFS